MSEYIESIQDLENSSSSIRLGIMRNLRLKIQHGLPLPSDPVALSALINRLKLRLSDSSPEVIVQILLFISDIIVATVQKSKDIAEQSLEPALLPILPQLVMLLGCSQSSVRKTALETHKCYLKCVKNPGPLITCLIKYGIENDEWRTRKESLSAFNILVTPEIGSFDPSHIAAALISRLRDVSDSVVQNAVNSLIHLKALIGEDALLGYVRKLSNISRQLFRQYQSRIIQDQKVRPSQQLQSKEESLAITGIPSPVKAIETISVSESQNLTASQNVIFGYVPEELINDMKSNSDHKLRSQSIEKLHQITQEITDPQVLKKDINSLLEYLVSFLNDSNFKIALTSIYIIGQVIDIRGLEIVHQMAYICTHLISKLSDNKAIIRQAAIKIIIKLMRNLEASAVLEICMTALGDDNPRIREEIINLTSTALLSFPKAQFSYKLIIKYLAPLLKDTKPKVKFVAMEALAIIAHLYTPEKTFDLLEEAGIDEECKELLYLRFNDPVLPQLTSDGILQHTISRSNNQTPTPSQLNRENSRISSLKVTSKSNIFAKSFLEQNRPSSEIGIASTDGKNISDSVLEAKLSKMALSTHSITHIQELPAEMRRSRSFSETEAASAKADLISMNTFTEKTVKSLSSIYAPDFKRGSASIISQQDDHAPKPASPFASSSKLRRTPPIPETVIENEGIGDKVHIYRKDMFGSDQIATENTSETPKSAPAIRTIKTFSAPPDHLRTLDDEASPQVSEIETSPLRAKTSLSKSPKLSIATRRRLEAKTTLKNNPAQELEKQKILKKQFEDDYTEAMQLIRSNSEWNEISGALAVVQKAIQTRPDLVQDGLHDVTLSLVTQVHNLRSSVAKLAISCFNEMFVKFQKLMDNDLDITVGAILKKIGESGFLVEEAVKCLSSMIQNVTNTRAITVLITNADHKNSAIRLRVSLLLESAITSFNEFNGAKYASSIREMEKLLPVLIRFLREGLAESRHAAKRSLYFLSKFQDFDKNALKTLSSSQMRELNEAIDFIRSKGKKQDVFSPKGRKFPILIADDHNLDIALEPLSKPKGSLKAKMSPMRLQRDKSDDYDVIYTEISSVDWKRRSQGIDNISKVILHSPDDFKDRHSVQKLFDVYLARCRDGNSKVTILALENLTKIIPVLGPFLDSVLNLLIPAITGQMISSTPQIRRLSGEVMDKLIEFSDSLSIIQSLTNIVQFGNNPKLKPLIIDKLCTIVSSHYSTKSAQIIKYIIPVSVKLLKESRPELRSTNDKLLQSLKNQMGSTLLTYTGSQTNLVKERISTLERS